MAGITNAESKRVLDLAYPATGSGHAVAYSANGTSETSSLARTAIGSWSAATTADPSVKSNASALTSANPSADVTVTHAAVFTATSGGTQVTDWLPLTGGSRALVAGADTLVHPVGSIVVTLT